MADLALGGLERIVRAALKIKKAVETVQQNKEECRDIQRCAARITDLLSWLKDLTMGEVMHPAFSGPLDDLADSMEAALELITDCQQRSALRHLLGAGDMAKQLRRVHDDILRKLAPANFATSILQVQISVSVTNTLHYVGAHPPLLPQVAGGVNSYDSNLSAIEMRPGVNSNTTMVATGNAVPCASSSRLAEFNWSEGESTLHLSSEEHISEGGHAFVLKQKIVIKVAMLSSRSRAKALAVLAAWDGVYSMEIDGAGMDCVVVVGQGVDCVKLISALRKKTGYADLLEFGPAGSGDEEEEEDPHPSSSNNGKGKQSLQVARPHVAIRPDGSSAKGFLGYLRSRFCFANHE